MPVPRTLVRIPRNSPGTRALETIGAPITHARMQMNDFAAHRDDWTAREELAERMIPLIGALKRDTTW